MNAAQARAIASLIDSAARPDTCPITGQKYTEDERADWDPAYAITGSYVPAKEAPEGRGELLEVRLRPQGIVERTRELYVDSAGALLLWSTVRIPPEDCECECEGPPESKVDRSDCPRHGDSVRELDCWREVAGTPHWVIDHRRPIILPHRESVRAGDRILGVHTEKTIAGPTPYWRFEVKEGRPLDDPLARHRQARTVTP